MWVIEHLANCLQGLAEVDVISLPSTFVDCARRTSRVLYRRSDLIWVMKMLGLQNGGSLLLLCSLESLDPAVVPILVRP